MKNSPNGVGGRHWLLVVTLLLASCAVSCRDRPAKESLSDNPDSSTNRQQFQVNGIIKRFTLAEHRVVIAHEEITNYMAAMTMPFRVKNTNELAGLKPGDAVSFRYVVLPDDDWIEQIERIAAPAVLIRDRTSFVPFVDQLEVGDDLPACQFTNQAGTQTDLSELKGQALALGFFFSRCTVSNSCPRLTAEFAAVQRLLTHDEAAPRNWQLLLVSLDPARDTPEILREYSERTHADPVRWQFLTGEAQLLSKFADQCGVAVLAHTNTIVHNLRVVVVNPSGRVQRIFKGNDWTSASLTRELAKAASGN